MPPERLDRPAVGAPRACGGVAARRHDLAVGAERDVLDEPRMAIEQRVEGTRSGTPDTGCLVCAPGGDQLARAIVGHGQYPTDVASQHVGRLPRPRVPQAGGAIHATGCDETPGGPVGRCRHFRRLLDPAEDRAGGERDDARAWFARDHYPSVAVGADDEPLDVARHGERDGLAQLLAALGVEDDQRPPQDDVDGLAVGGKRRRSAVDHMRPRLVATGQRDQAGHPVGTDHERM